MKIYSVTEDQLKTLAKNCGCPPDGVKTVGNIFLNCRCNEYAQLIAKQVENIEVLQYKLSSKAEARFHENAQYAKQIEELQAKIEYLTEDLDDGAVQEAFEEWQALQEN